MPVVRVWVFLLHKFKKLKIRYLILTGICLLVLLGFAVPEIRLIPVKDASTSDWNPDTFWYEPWGKSGVHKGIDIFAAKGAEVLSATPGLVLYQGTLPAGGKVVAVLGPKWRLHYYAHLDTIQVHGGRLLSAGEKIGSVGDSGNAKGKAPHLHYVILTLFPHVWKIDSDTQGWKKMFYLDPGRFLTEERAGG